MLGALALAGCSGAVCGEGTFDKDGTCLPDTASDIGWPSTDSASDTDTDADADTDTDTDADTDTDTDADTDTDTDADTDTDTDADTDTDTDASPAPTVERRLSLGSYHGMYLDPKGFIYPWGAETGSQSYGIIAGTPDYAVRSVDLNNTGACAILTNDIVQCWGTGDAAYGVSTS